jgi:hypothetical protein
VFSLSFEEGIGSIFMLRRHEELRIGDIGIIWNRCFFLLHDEESR